MINYFLTKLPLDRESSSYQFLHVFCSNRGAVIGLSIILLFIFLAFFANLLAPYRFDQIFADSLREPLLTQSQTHYFFLGTDDVGRDLLSRLIKGAQVSLGIGLFVVIMATLIGTTLGLIAGYFQGITDALIMRFVDILMSLPSILLAIVIVAVLGPGLINALWAVTLVALPAHIRIVRASVLAEKESQYVKASQSFASPTWRILFVTILPNCMGPLIVQASLTFSDAILNTAALGFLGLGAQPPTPEWGTMLADGRSFMESAPHLVMLPGLCILTVVLAFNLLGDGLRDALDPKLKK